MILFHPTEARQDMRGRGMERRAAAPRRVTAQDTQADETGPVSGVATDTEARDGGNGAVLQTLDVWAAVIGRAGVPEEQARHAALRAHANATPFVAELLASGCVGEGELFRAIAADLGLEFLPALPPQRLIMTERSAVTALGVHFGQGFAPFEQPGGKLIFVVASANLDLSSLRARLTQSPNLRVRLRVGTPSAMRAAFLARARDRLLDKAQHDLFLSSPDLSARTVANAWQGCLVGVLALLLLLGMTFAPLPTLFAVDIVATVAFLACVAVRLLAVGRARPLRRATLEPVAGSELPIYSVLVALYRERAVVPQLLVSLGKLQWPHAKLEIKLVCEEDDEETLAALRAHRLRPCVEVVVVPPGGPRTKPKALSYALPLCSGEFVTLFDAEDRPHPNQLMEAWRRFRDEGDDLGCLQAPLVVANIERHPLARMFGFEYAGLFRGLLPWLAHNGRVLPLGGTSNHFRRKTLVEIGGWDPYNVTEDADLGLRFRRLGYRTGVLTCPTMEDAPEDVATWLPQRVRWFKGWLQTWLVHMRNPRLLWNELGPANFVLAQVVSLGAVVSAMVHPVMLATTVILGARLAMAQSLPFFETAMLALCLLSLALGYGAFIAIGAATLASRERAGLGRIILMTPFYWMLLSVAGWLALWEIYRRPHHWNKTEHKPAQATLPRRASSGAPVTEPLAAATASVTAVPAMAPQ